MLSLSACFWTTLSSWDTLTQLTIKVPNFGPNKVPILLLSPKFPKFRIRSRSWDFCQIFEGFGFGFGQFGLRKKSRFWKIRSRKKVSVSENLVSEKESRYRFRSKFWYRHSVMPAKIQLSCPPSSGPVTPLYHRSNDVLLYFLMVDNVDMVDAPAFITRICEACRWRRGREPAAISSCHWGRGTTHLCLIPWDSKCWQKKGEGGFDGQTCARISWGICKYQFPILP